MFASNTLRAGVLLSLFVGSTSTCCAETETSARQEVRISVNQLDQWLGKSPHCAAWRSFLRFDQLDQELSKQNQADPMKVSQVLRQCARGGDTSDRTRVVRVRRALEGWLDRLPPPPSDQLTATTEASSNVFIPLTPIDVTEAQGNLDASTARLGKRMLRAGPEAAAWKDYLKWDRLQAELTSEDGPDLDVLDQVYARFAAGHHGLKLVWFDDVRLDLQTYLSRARAVEDPDLETKYKTLMKAFPQHLEAYRDNPTPDRAVVIGSVLQWLKKARQGRYLRSSIRHHFCKPNLFVEISEPMLSAGMAQPVRETRPVHDVILGTNVRGTAQTIGQVGIELIPSSNQIHFNAVLRGTIYADTIGTNGPARIFTTSITPITAWKPIYLDGQGVRSGLAWCNATTHSTIKDICAVRAPRLVTRIAWKRSDKQKGEADQIASHKARVQLQRSTDQRGDESVKKLNARYLQKFRKPLEERKLFPARLHFSTTSDAIHIRSLQAGPFDLAASSDPPKNKMRSDLSVHLHESMLNNVASQVFSGAILKEKQLLADITKWLGTLPKILVPDEDEEDWGITFARRQPISVSFDDGLLKLTLRGREFAKGDATYPGMNVTAIYKIEQTAKGFKAVRQGDLEIFPPGFQPGKDRFSVREQVLQDMLQDRFLKMFASELEVPDLEFPGRFSQVGKMRLVQWEAEDGWMTMSWRR